MAEYEELSQSFQVRSSIPYSWMNQIGENFTNHEGRIDDTETSAADHASRIDLLESNGPSTERTYTASVVLSDQQIRELPTSSVQIVAAPGLGYRFKVVELTYDLDTSAAAYGNVDATAAYLWVGASASALLAADLANDSAVTHDQLSAFLTLAHAVTHDVPVPYMAGVTGTTAGELEYIAPGYHAGLGMSVLNNAALKIGLFNNGAGNLTGGDSFMNYLRVMVGYRILPIVSASMPFRNTYAPMRRRAARPRSSVLSSPSTLIP